MHVQCLTPRPGVLDGWDGGHSAHLHLNIDLAHTRCARARILYGVKRGAVFAVEHDDRLQPMINKG